MSTGVEAWENVENRYVGKRNIEVTWVNIGGGNTGEFGEGCMGEDEERVHGGNHW